MKNSVLVVHLYNELYSIGRRAQIHSMLIALQRGHVMKVCTVEIGQFCVPLQSDILFEMKSNPSGGQSWLQLHMKSKIKFWPYRNILPHTNQVSKLLRLFLTISNVLLWNAGILLILRRKFQTISRGHDPVSRNWINTGWGRAACKVVERKFAGFLNGRISFD